MGDIYAIQCIETDKIYIGQSYNILERLRNHFSEARNQPKNECRYLNRAIRKYGEDNFVLHKIDFSSCEKELDEMEIFYISYFKSLAPNGYNLSSGGKGCYKPTAETLIKMSIWQKKVPKSLESRQRMSESAKNRSESHRKAIRESNSNRIISNETRLKQSKKRRKLPDEKIEEILISIKEIGVTKTAKLFSISDGHVSRIKRGWRPLGLNK